MPPELNLNVAGGGPPVEQPNNVVVNGNGNHNANNGNNQSGNDRFNGTVAGQLVLNCFNSHLSPFGRSVIELINSNNELSPSTRQLITDLVSDRSFRLQVIDHLYGPEVVRFFDKLHKKDSKEAEQRGILMCLLAIAEPAQIISAINSIKGALVPQLQSLAAGMLEQAWDLGKWLAEKKAKQGDSSYALALYQAGQVGGGENQSTVPIQTFITFMTTSYDPTRILTDAQSTADEANRRNCHQVTVMAEINQLENIVGNSTENNLAVNRARTRLTDLRSVGLG